MTYYLFTIGCQMNKSDAERIANILDSHKYTKAADEQSADLIIVVSCSVRQKAMDRIYGRVNKWRSWKKKRNIKIVLTGCVLPSDRKKLAKEVDFFVAIKDINKLPKLLGPSKTKTPTEQVTNADYLALQALHESSFKAFVPIMTGCNNYCTYCAVPHTRGQEASRPSSEIIAEVKQLVANGYKEITLLGQNVNAYIDPEKKHGSNMLKTRSRDFWQFQKNQPVQFRSATTKVPKDFANLLKKINKIPGEFWLRFLTSNPQDVSEELIKTLPQCEKVTKHFHLPIQSGDDEILRRMNRRHTIKYYLGLIKKIRCVWPDAAITTDIIVGFPGETKKQFQQTVSLMKQVKYDMAYIARYSPRPGTAAERFFKDDVSIEEKTRRETVLNKILEKTALANNKKLVGKTVRVLVENYNHSKNENIGKTETFKNVRYKGNDLTGQFVNIKITKVGAWGLAGKLVKPH